MAADFKNTGCDLPRSRHFFHLSVYKMQRSPGRYGDIYDVCADVLPGLSGKICRSAPGSPEYEAIERAQTSRIKASQERLYRKQHPFMVARELVESNKSIPSRAQKKTEPPKKDSVGSDTEKNTD